MTGTATIELRVKPRSKHDRIDISPDGTINVAVTSPPVDGKANEHVIKLLSKKLGVSKSSIDFIKGEGSRNKVVAVTGLTKDQIMALAGAGSSRPR
jgi:uncharacterized protein